MSTNNLLATVPSGVLPNGVFTSFVESRIYPVLVAQYHDGTQERGLITDGETPGSYVTIPDSIKTWKLQVRRKTASPGQWSSATTYRLGASVTYNGIDYTSAGAGNIGHTPGVGIYWTVAPISLKTFYENHGGPLKSFYFYNPLEPQTGHAVGSNWDATGDSTYGRYTCKFLNPAWVDSSDIARTNVSIDLIEVA